MSLFFLNHLCVNFDRRGLIVKRQKQSSKEEYLKKYDQNMKSGLPALKKGMFYYMLLGLILLAVMVITIF